MRLASFLLLLAATLHAEEPFAFEKTPGKLPKEIVPLSYTLALEPDVSAKTFKGSETIAVQVLKPVREIVLNSLGLEITSATLDAIQLTPQLDEQRQTLTFALPSALPPGKYDLRLSFTGKLTEQPQGLFLSPFQNGDKKQIALTTQFEATDARRMFPCWDEPAFRAVFGLKVTFPKQLIAVSNMPVEREELDAERGQKTVTFGHSPSMPTYLLALTIGELESIHDEADGTRLGIYFTAGKREQARYAMDATKKLLPWFNEYFGTKYPLPKLDQIALPSTAASGMENWGAIIYNDNALLYDPAKSSQATKERVFDVVAHEIAHQWFGNLVTMAWWDNLWLNEGFASWIGTKATDHFNPDWKMWLRAAGGKEHAMALDARATTHPIQQPVEDEAQAGDAFDEITYQKGQAFLRMLESWLGEEPFRTGLRAYMQKHAYSNTTTADLWLALEEASGKQVREMARGWTEQPGFPVVNVLQAAHQEAGNVAVALGQERFTIHQSSAPPLTWQIPIGLAHLGGIETNVLIENRLALEFFKGADSLIVANVEGRGYFRTRYDDATFARLHRKVLSLPEADRLNLLNDTWALVQAKRARAADFLNLATKLAVDDSSAVLDALLDKLWFIDRLLVSREETTNRGTRGAFHAWARKLLQPQLTRLGWEATPGESPLAAQLRGYLVSTLGEFGDEAVLRQGRARFAAFLEKPESLPGDLRAAVLTLAGRHGDAATWNQLRELARTENSFEQKRTLYGGLASAADPALAAKTLQLTLGDELVAQDATRLLGRVAHEGEHPELAWEFAQAHLETLSGKLSTLGANEFVPNLLRAFHDAERADELEAFAKKRLPSGATPAVARAADEIRFKAEFKARFLPELEAWLK